MKSRHVKKKINNNILLVLAIFLIIVNLYNFMLSTKDVVTGQAGTSGVAQICIGRAPDITSPTPDSEIIVSGLYNSSVQGNYTSNITFLYYTIGNSQVQFGWDDDADNDTYFNSTLDTTAIADGNCNYRITADAEGVCGMTTTKESSLFSVNNTDVAPTWDEFKNSISTNFSLYSSWTNIADARIAVTDYGIINFTTTNLDGADLDHMFEIMLNTILLNTSTTYNCFDDVEYGITFFNATPTLTLQRNGVTCGSECYNFNNASYVGDNFSFSTTVAGEVNFTIITDNNAPVLTSDISNQTWPQDTSISPFDLDDHFTDPDNDTLTYNWSIDISQVNVSLDGDNVVTFTPDPGFFGIGHITFYANDGITSTASNEVTLTVAYSAPTPAPSGGGGGGVRQPKCDEDWLCTDWGVCYSTGWQFRDCSEQNDCRTEYDKPATSRLCEYVPTCHDRIRNQGEEGVDCGGPCSACGTCEDGILNRGEIGIDCGGPCPSCGTCFDGVQNQDEEGADCGGPCVPCITCEDGIRNQGETGVDCGGPCPSCAVKMIEQAVNMNPILAGASILAALAIILLALIFGVFKNKLIRFKSKLLNYYMRSSRMLKLKKLRKEVPINNWAKTHLDSIEEAIPVSSINKSVNAVDRLARIFFKRVFLIRYSFTTKELLAELQKNRMPAVLTKATELLFDELSQIKYGGEKIDQGGVKTLVGQVRVITDRIVNEIEVMQNKKIGISERDIRGIEKTMKGARKLSVQDLVKRKK
ncbi:cadherin-like domain-containing protein [Candidatus Woesearchaeota archaeon]|nr:cadherin-like domain-containing protein [Candidatus Woesearchaeota archaeon]